MTQLFAHDPSANLDYSFDWSSWLAAGETITAQTVTPSTGITLGTTTQLAGVVTTWITAATTSGTIACHITTSAGRQDSRYMGITVTPR
jgi:hypothetical protein